MPKHKKVYENTYLQQSVTHIPAYLYQSFLERGKESDNWVELKGS